VVALNSFTIHLAAGACSQAPHRCSTWQLCVAAVAERRVLGMFAATPRYRFGFGDIHLRRGEARVFVRPVAERLALGLTATAPIIGAGLGGLNKGPFAGNFWFTHVVLGVSLEPAGLASQRLDLAKPLSSVSCSARRLSNSFRGASRSVSRRRMMAGPWTRRASLTMLLREAPVVMTAKSSNLATSGSASQLRMRGRLERFFSFTRLKRGP